MYLVPFFLTNNIVIKSHVLYFSNNRKVGHGHGFLTSIHLKEVNSRQIT
jgi:hypothetical protein